MTSKKILLTNPAFLVTFPTVVHQIKKIGLSPMKKGGNNATEEENQLFLDRYRHGCGPSYVCLRDRSCRKDEPDGWL
jgi:hypothetical protein